MSVSVPLAGPEPSATVSVSPSTSAQVTVSLSAVSSAVTLLPSLQVGASLTGSTVIVNVASAEVSVPSVAVKVKLSVPLKPGRGRR